MNPGSYLQKHEKEKWLWCGVHINKKQWGPLKAPVRLTLATSAGGWIIGKQERSGGTFARAVICLEYVRCDQWLESKAQVTITTFSAMASQLIIRLLDSKERSTLYYCCRYNNYNAHKHYNVSPNVRHETAVILTEAATCPTRTVFHSWCGILIAVDFKCKFSGVQNVCTCSVHPRRCSCLSVVLLLLSYLLLYLVPLNALLHPTKRLPHFF